MKKILLITMLLTISIMVKAQKNTPDTSEVFTTVDHLPEFPGGDAKFQAYIDASLKKAKRSDKTSGRVIVTFIIEKNGSTSAPKAMVGFNREADSMAVSIVLKSPNWKPAIKDHKVVRCKFSAAITFGDPTDLPPLVKQLAN